MPRPQKCRMICTAPISAGFLPLADGDRSDRTDPPDASVIMGIDEYETIRLMDLEGLTQAQCAGRMGIARTTVTRIYDAARKKIADALVHGKGLAIKGGQVNYCDGERPDCAKRLDGCPCKQKPVS